MPVVKVGKDNKIEVPQEILDRLGAKPGDLLQVNFELLEESLYTDEPLGPEAQAALREALEDVAAGRLEGPFDSADELIAYLRSKRSESA